MKTNIIITLGLSLITASLSNAQCYHDEDFSNGIGNFSALNNTTVSTTDGILEFVNTNNQGAGVTIDLDQAGVLGSNFNNFTTNTDGSMQSIFFQFTTIVPPNSGAQDELGFFFGPSSGQAQSSDIFNGQNTNGFTVFFDNGGLFAVNNTQGSQSNAGNTVNILAGLEAGSEVTIDLEWFLTPAQNNGQYNNAFTVDATGTQAGTGNTLTATDQTFDGAQNQGSSQINNYQFTATTTQGLSGSIDDFTVSTKPIPEPSGILLTGVGALTMLLRRKRA